MKKVVIMAAAIALFATPALAGIATTKHNLASSASSNTFKGTADEICVYCHTPHGGQAGFAPLWNRTNGSVNSVYTSSTLNATVNTTGASASDALLCLSCHDGVSLSGSLTNPPNAGGTNPAGNITGNANLGSDLNNDHPVGFVYSTATADGEINATPAGLKVTYGVSSDSMWCSSCHDVHSNAFPPFLAKNNQGSALCLTCHSK